MWDLNAWERNPNLAPAFHRIYFHAPTKEWNLRLRELAMVLFNPVHRRVREHGIFLPLAPAAVSTVRGLIGSLTRISSWAVDTGLSENPRHWTRSDVRKFMALPETLNKQKYHKAFKFLYKFSGLLTHGGLKFDPWPGNSIEKLTGSPSRGKSIKTRPIAPEVWWPLLRASWKYIDTFAPDILEARERYEEYRINESRRQHGPCLRTIDMIQRWVKNPMNFVPLQVDFLDSHPLDEARPLGPQGINGPLLSSMISGGFKRDLYSNPRTRRIILEIITDSNFRDRFRPYPLIENPALVESAAGELLPWVEGMSTQRLWKELVMARTACYIFVAALSMLRDSELQGIVRDSVVQHFGYPAIRTKKFKHDRTRAEHHWWIIDPVAKALKVAESISDHPSKVFAPVRETQADNGLIWAHKDIKKFIRHINDHHAEFGLELIPSDDVSPHMFRRTMSIITREQPDGEIALGLTLKHTAIRALSNASTGGYGEPTAEWAKELGISLSDANLVRLVSFLGSRRAKEVVAAGPGARKFTQKLDRVVEQLEGQPDFAGSIADDRVVRNALRGEFSTIKFGNLNACLGDLDSALCVSAMQSEIGDKPFINPARCQPHLCKNSVVTEKHLPQWIATEADILKSLKDRRMSKTNRAALQKELSDIRTVIGDVSATDSGVIVDE